jgi:cephalosporin-C deacetylase-like acetyl esterase
MIPSRLPRVHFVFFVSGLVTIVGALADGAAGGELPRALPPGQLPADARLGPLTTLGGYFPFDPPNSRKAWQQRAEQLRRQLLVALGLWPMPEKGPLRAVIHGKVQRDEYTVEKVYFESFPGHFVTGSLYRPQGKSGPRPGVLCPHGHWANGRFHVHGPKQIAEELKSGAERYEKGGRHPLQARCVQLARLGCVVFHYDMVGYADSIQLEHRPGVRESMSSPEAWGYFSPQAELRLETMMGLQTFNSIRALDFLCGLEDVDPERIGVTGASGGGTQTFILCAIDPRPKVAFPAVMVSTAMQGGCTCENASYLRIGTGNVEIAALFAPKPLGMTAALDWTKEMETKGLPELKRLYGLYDAKDKVMLAAYLQFGHNYNYVSRAAMYSWMHEHLPLGVDPLPEERDFEPLSIAEMSVWDEDHPRPPSGDDYERSLLKTITTDSEKQLAELVPKDAASLERFRQVVGAAWSVLIGRGLPAHKDVKLANSRLEQRQGYIQVVGLLAEPARGAELPIVFLAPSKPSGDIAIWIDPAGKAGLFDDQGEPRKEIRRLLEGGVTVLGVDLLYQGEFLNDGKPLEKQPMVADALVGYVGYTFGYNHPLFSKRVQDILTAISHVKNPQSGAKRVYLVGASGAGAWVAAAKALAGNSIDRCAIDTAGFRFASLTELAHPDFLPGSVKYGDLPALLALCVPGELWIAGEDALPDLLQAVASTAGGAGQITLHADSATAAQGCVEWLLR